MRFLFCPLASHGYIYPAIRVAQSLQALGHTVGFVTGSGFDSELDEANCPRVNTGSEPSRVAFRVSLWGSTKPNVLQVALVREAAAVFQPDAIVASSMALGAILFAKWHHIPVAVLGLGTYMWPTCENAPLPNSTPDEVHTDSGLRYLTVMHIANQIASICGHTPYQGDYDQFPLLGDLYLLRSISALQANHLRLPTKVRLVGACTWYPSVDQNAYRTLAAALDTDMPICFVQHDNRWSRQFEQENHMREGIPDFWETLVSVLADRPVRVIVSTNDSDLVTATQPDNFFVDRFIPHQLIFPRADYVIATGTSSVMLAALSHGLPMLQIVTASENFLVAERCAETGVAICLPVEDVTEARLRESFGRLTSDQTLETNAQRMAADFADMRECNHAANLIINMVHQKQPAPFSQAHAPVSSQL
ncbi:MAG: glycosyltransferase [Candidatus Promineifilaceae bacterium]